MITADDKLELLEHFQVDRKLPKHQPKKVKDDGTRKQVAQYENSDDEMMSSDDFMVRQGERVVFTQGQMMVGDTFQPRIPWYQWLFRKLFPWWMVDPKPKPKKHVVEITIDEFFRSIKNNAEELRVVEGRAAGYEQAMTNARQSGQVAFWEQLKEGLEVHRGETQLIAIRTTRYVTEETVVRFVKKAAKGLRFDWVANFTRPIPAKVVDAKLRADERFIFDNYAILHYDPGAKSWAETQAQKAARARDPILFGVMKGSRNLYFVGDWVDEQCNLTLTQIVDLLGKEVVKELS